MLRRLDDAGGWVGELRKAAGIANPEFNVEAAREKIARRERELAATKAPEKPADATPEQLAAWEKRARVIEESRQQLQARIDEGRAKLAEMEKPKADFDTDAIIREIFLRTVSRPPTTGEMTNAKADIAAAKSPVEGLRELLWVMLNTREFLVNR
jgi:hypothetical protein